MCVYMYVCMYVRTYVCINLVLYATCINPVLVCVCTVLHSQVMCITELLTGGDLRTQVLGYRYELNGC